MNGIRFEDHQLDMTGSLRDYDFTRRAIANLRRVTSSSEFQEMDSETIFRYLKEEMEIVAFGDYLKRFIYENTAPPQAFRDVPEEYYVQVITDSFTANRAPHAFSPVTSRWGSIIRRWLRSETVRRDTIFLLGFGLRMTDAEVTEFLVKVIKEQDFCFGDPREAVFWHCFHAGLPYSRALSLLEEPGDPVQEKDSSEEIFWERVKHCLPVYLSNERMLRQYLGYLAQRRADARADLAEEFLPLYERAAAAARQITGKNKEAEEKRGFTGAYDIESVLCGGMPRTPAKNLEPLTGSVLAGHFAGKRMSRQRLGRLLQSGRGIERFDLLSLLFLVYCAQTNEDDPRARCLRFIDEADALLTRCHMMELYPVNPYESFILMCLLAEEPLSVYNDVWEFSFE